MKRLFLLCVIFFLICCGCKNKSPDRIRVENRLGKKVICVLGYNYPDLKLNFINKKDLLADTDFFLVDTNEVKEVDTLGLCKKDVWNNYVKQSLLMLIVFDKDKLIHAKKLEDALVERYYFSYTQIVKDKGVIVVY